MGVTAQWLKLSLNKFRERFQIRKIREIKDPRNISAITVFPAIQYVVFFIWYFDDTREWLDSTNDSII